MTAEPPNLIAAARLGNPKAITTLISRSLAPKGINVRVFVQDKCLSVFLESAQELDPQMMAAYIRKGLLGLGIQTVRQVKLVSRKTGSERASWIQEFLLDSYIEPVTAQVEIVKSSAPTASVSRSGTRGKPIAKSNPLTNLSSRTIAIAAGSTLAFLCLTGGISAIWMRSAQAKAITQATEAVKEMQSPNADNPLDIKAMQANRGKLEQAISILQKTPQFGLMNDGRWSTELNKYQEQLQTINQNIEAYEKLRPVVQEVVDEFSAMNSSLDVGINYRDYGSEVRKIKIALDRLGRQPGGKELAIYKSLDDAFREYSFANDVWKTYFDDDDASNNFLPATSSVGRTLVVKYGVEAESILSNKYIYLNTALATVWQKAGQYVQSAQEKM